MPYTDKAKAKAWWAKKWADPDYRAYRAEYEKQRRHRKNAAARERRAARRAARPPAPVVIAPPREKWTPLPVGTEVAVPPRAPDVYLCPRNGEHTTKRQADRCTEGHYSLSPSLPTKYN